MHQWETTASHGFQLLFTTAFLSAVFLSICCQVEDSDGEECVSNSDCLGAAACVSKTCVSDTALCQYTGVFFDVIKSEPQHADTVGHFQVEIDQLGKVHYCYTGFRENEKVSYYGRQTGWQTFDEVPLTTPKAEPVQCGGLAITPFGHPYVLSTNPPAVLYSTCDGWQMVQLTGLTGTEAAGALRSPYTLVSLTPDALGGVYVGLSLGFELGFQPIYLAYLDKTTLTVLLNGWSEDGNHTAFGHAPQFFMHHGAQLAVGKWLDFEIALVQPDLDTATQFTGAYPRVDTQTDGPTSIVYVDHNRELYLNSVANNQLQHPVALGTIGPIEGERGRVPWDVTTDQYGTRYILYEDTTQGTGVLLYRSVDAAGKPGIAQIIANNLINEHGLPGMQTYSIGTDVCGRPVIAALVRNTESMEQITGPGLPVLSIIEGR